MDDARKTQICIIIFLTLVWLFHCVHTPALEDCPRGTYMYFLEGRVKCAPCPVGTYMPHEQHKLTNCFQCTQIQDRNLEILIDPCNSQYDADIRCIKGYYMDLNGDPLVSQKCKKCSNCSDGHVQVQSCLPFRDTLCCLDINNNKVIDHQDNSACVGYKRRLKCLRGERLDTLLNICKSCHKTTFMPDDYHSKDKCKPCDLMTTSDLQQGVILLDECTSTRPPRYGCKDGFHGNAILSYKPQEFRCYECQMCNDGMYIGRACDMYHDTVCCREADMVVVDGPSGAVCIRTEEMAMQPVVRTIRIDEGDCQTLQCSIALRTMTKIVWKLPNLLGTNIRVQTHQKHFDNNIIITTSRCTIHHITNHDFGEYRCSANIDGYNTLEAYLNIERACQYGTYNPPACDKNCSEHCGVSSVSDEKDVSPCDHVSGKCLFGCRDDYSGDLCNTKSKHDEHKSQESFEPDFRTGLVISTILNVILVIVLFYCLYKSGYMTCHLRRERVPNPLRKFVRRKSQIILARDTEAPKEQAPLVTYTAVQQTEGYQEEKEKPETDNKEQHDEIVKTNKENEEQHDVIVKTNKENEEQHDVIVKTNKRNEDQHDVIVKKNKENEEIKNEMQSVKKNKDEQNIDINIDLEMF